MAWFRKARLGRFIRRALRAAFTLAILGMQFCQPAAAQAAGPLKPNLVVILIDDMGYGGIGPFQDTLTARYTEEAVKFITANKDHPFFLHLAHPGRKRRRGRAVARRQGHDLGRRHARTHDRVVAR